MSTCRRHVCRWGETRRIVPMFRERSLAHSSGCRLARSRRRSSCRSRIQGGEELSLTPLFTSTCDLADRMPPLIADFLDIETSLRRRFREESVTDIFVASLVRISGWELSVQVPEDESKTGNDFDIIVFDPKHRTAVQYRIQAKRLTPHSTNWRLSSYVELAHPKNTGIQSLSLVRSAAAERHLLTVPLYAFYNPTRTCLASGGAVSGIELADGRSIRAVVRELVKSKPKRPPLKRISSLQPLFFPLSKILCPPAGEESRRVPTPEGSLRAVTDAVDTATERFLGQWAGEMPKNFADLRGSARRSHERSLQVPATLPSVIAAAIEMRSGTSRLVRTKSVERPRVVLFSD